MEEPQAQNYWSKQCSYDDDGVIICTLSVFARTPLRFLVHRCGRVFSLYVGKMPGGYGSRFAPSQSSSHKILLVSTALSLSLAIFAFTLQWRGGDLVETARLGDASGDAQRLPGVQLDSNSLTPLGGRTGTPISDCSKHQLPKVGLFPHHPGWQYALGNGTSSKVMCVKTLACSVLIKSNFVQES